jgi:hypothetical protein
MSLGNKQDLDSLLRAWPAVARDGARVGPAASASEPDGSNDDERRWDARADAIVRAARAAGAGDAKVLDMVLASPTLASEPGEPLGLSSGAAGEKKMSRENESGGTPPTSTPPAERKRSSLKELAERASQSGRGQSTPGLSSAPPSATPLPSSSPLARASSPGSTTTPLPRPSEAGKDDSGVVNLNVIQASVTPQQVAAAEKAKPATHDLLDDAEKSADAPKVEASKPVLAKVATPPAEPKNKNGVVIGLAIAAVGLAAAFMITMKDKPKPQATAQTQTTAAAVAPATAEAKAEVAPTAQPAASATAEAAGAGARSVNPRGGGWGAAPMRGW